MDTFFSLLWWGPRWIQPSDHEVNCQIADRLLNQKCKRLKSHVTLNRSQILFVRHQIHPIQYCRRMRHWPGVHHATIQLVEQWLDIRMCIMSVPWDLGGCLNPVWGLPNLLARTPTRPPPDSPKEWKFFFPVFLPLPNHHSDDLPLKLLGSWPAPGWSRGGYLHICFPLVCGQSRALRGTIIVYWSHSRPILQRWVQLPHSPTAIHWILAPEAQISLPFPLRWLSSYVPNNSSFVFPYMSQ